MTDYVCSTCHTPTDRSLLTVKKVHFLEMGERPITFKTRTESWLCPKCLVKDPTWNLEKWDAPGMKVKSNARG